MILLLCYNNVSFEVKCCSAALSLYNLGYGRVLFGKLYALSDFRKLILCDSFFCVCETSISSNKESSTVLSTPAIFSLSIFEVFYLSQIFEISLYTSSYQKLDYQTIINSFSSILSYFSLYKQLKTNGLFVRSGEQLSVNFVGYTNLPHKCHAHVAVDQKSEEMTWLNVIAKQRVCAANGKMLVLTENDGDGYQFLSLNRWEP
ncbi:hypothetical protein RCL1_003872 [Eukaryota sp. TZLM3-RCL]